MAITPKYDALLDDTREEDSGSGSFSIVQEDGVTVSIGDTTLNFTGPGVSVSTVGGVVTITITGGGAAHGPSYQLEDGSGYYLLEDGSGVYLLE